MKQTNHSEAHPGQRPETAKPITKAARILEHLMTGASINRFEAERIGDHCLPSTIAALANRDGLMFTRRQESVPSRWGVSCIVTRYSLPSSQYEAARQVLLRLTSSRRPVEE